MNALSGGSFRYLSRVAVALAFALSGNAGFGFEQDQRINSLTWQFLTDTFATRNALGGAVTGTFARQGLQDTIGSRIQTGSISLLFRMPGLTDLTGTNEPSLQLGVVNGSPVILPNNPATYSGASDLDWWYSLNSNELDATGSSLQQISGAIAAKVLNAGPGRLTLANTPIGGGGPLAMSSVMIRATTGAASTPLRSTNNFPPGHRPGENIDPALQSFAAMSSGQLKGNVSAATLASSPIDPTLIGGTQGYTASNSMLDVFVGGWSHFIAGTQIRATQPDEVDSNAPPVGAGAPYTLVADPTTKKVIACRDRVNASVDLAAGLNAAAYSAYFKFTTDRVIALTPPEIVLEQPLGIDIVDGGARSFGTLSLGTNASATFTIRNTGLVDLTGVAITIDGTDASAFTVLTNPPVAVPGANGSTSFTVRFAPASTGPKTAALRIASDDRDENPFDIFVSGLAITPPDLAVNRLQTGALRFGFANHPAATFTVLSTTQLELPLSNWTILGSATQTAPGFFEFTDPDATNHTWRFYTVRSP